MLLTVITKFIAAIDAIFPTAKTLNPVQIVILATIIFSATIAIFPGINRLLNKRSVGDSFNSFMYSFLGGLLGGFAGIIIGFVSVCIIYLIIPPQLHIGPEIIFYVLWLMTFWVLLWLVGVSIGAIATIRPLIKFFSKS